jgi:hypothetical protein
VFKKISIFSLCIAATLTSLAAFTPVPLNPASGSSDSYQFPNFSWTPHPEAWGNIESLVEYEIQIARDSKFTSLVDEDTITIPRYVHDRPFQRGSYFWRVRAVQNSLASVDWSAAIPFMIEAPDATVSVEYSIGGEVRFTDAVSLAVERARELASNGRKIQIDFAEGDYWIDSSFRGHLIVLKDDANITINGNGARIYFSDRKQGLIIGDDCTKVIVANFKCSFPSEKLYIQGSVTGVDAESRRMTVGIAPGYSDFNQSDSITNDVFQLMDPNHRGRLKDGAANFMRGTDFEENSDGTWSFTVSEARRNDFALGDSFVFKFRAGSPQLVDFPNANEVTAYGIETDGYGNMFFRSIEGSHFNMLHSKTAFGDRNPSGLVSGVADGIHVRGHAVGPWMEALHIEGIGDDGVALFARPSSIAEPVSKATPRTAVCNAEFFNLEPGDEVSFFQATKGLILLETQVVSVREGEDGSYSVVFADDLPTGMRINGHLIEVVQIWNRSKSCGDFALRNSEFINIRRYGTVFRSKGGLVEDNRYVGCSSHAIAFKNEPPFPNGLYASEIVVRDNVISESGFDWDGLPNIAFKFTGLRVGARSIGARNLRIEANHFIDCPSPEIALISVRDAISIGNRSTTGKVSKSVEVYVSKSEGIISVETTP